MLEKQKQGQSRAFLNHKAAGASNGRTVLPSTIAFMRPGFVFGNFQDLAPETSWHG
jgi:hypothetical protein